MSAVAEFGSLEFLVDSQLAIEKRRVATQVRHSHLKRNDRSDPETDELLRRLVEIEDYIDGRVADIISSHPAYPWFSRVKGVGKENIGKVVGLINIEKAPTISSLWKFCGYHVENGKAPKRKSGEKLSYNSRLRTMCWRLGTAMLKAGIRQFCVECGAPKPPAADAEDSEAKEPICNECGSKDFESKPTSKFAGVYLAEKQRLLERYANAGVQVVPAAQLPKNAEGKRYEPENMISEGHVHNQALRKMIKLFLGCLWLAWREAEGLPTRSPYPIEKLDHTGLISPEEMTDR